MKGPRDNQREAVYRWQGRLKGRTPKLAKRLSIAEVHNLADQVCRDYDISKPTIIFREGKFCTYWGGGSFDQSQPGLGPPEVGGSPRVGARCHGTAR
jgi:hypothetical protein